MEEGGNSVTHKNNGSNSNSNHSYGGGFLEASKADRAMWLMKCPALVSRSLQSPVSLDDPSRPVAKVILSIDPLASNDDNDSSSPQVHYAFPHDVYASVCIVSTYAFWVESAC